MVLVLSNLAIYLISFFKVPYGPIWPCKVLPMLFTCLIWSCLSWNNYICSCIVLYSVVRMVFYHPALFPLVLNQLSRSFMVLYGFVWRCMLFCNTVGCLIILFGPVGFAWSGFVLYDLLQQCLLLLGFFRHCLFLKVMFGPSYFPTA